MGCRSSVCFRNISYSNNNLIFRSELSVIFSFVLTDLPILFLTNYSFRAAVSSTMRVQSG